MKRYIAITNQSVWLLEELATGFICTGRASFGTHMPTDRDYSGPVISPAPRVGTYLVVQTVGGVVTSGNINLLIEVPA